MATTRLIARHISKGETIAQSLADSFDYGQNPAKTRDGELISAYMCDPKTADAEFLLSKARYKAITGREQKKDADILCYQIRQAFLPGEITPEEANRIGYETAIISCAISNERERSNAVIPTSTRFFIITSF